jgi:5,10-methylenetetrahydromethanopterin reductase
MGIAIYPRYPAAETRALATEIEGLGFSQIWIPDQRWNHDVGVVLAIVAMSTERIGIGSAVTDPYIRHPALTAAMMGSIDELAGGRLTVGIGTGLAGFRNIGINPIRSVRAIREAMGLMRALWTGGPTTFRGETVSFVDGHLEYDVLRPNIPIYVAGRGPQVLRLAGSSAEGVLIGSLVSGPNLAYALRHVDRGLGDARRTRSDIEVAIWLHTAIATEPTVALDALRSPVANVLYASRGVLDEIGLPIPAHVRRTLDRLEESGERPDLAEIGAMLDDETMGHFSVAGTGEMVAARIAELHAAGIDHVALNPWLVPGQTLEAFARSIGEAMPDLMVGVPRSRADV